MSIYLIKIQNESQPSVLKIIYEEAAEGQTWGETKGASHFITMLSVSLITGGVNCDHLLSLLDFSTVKLMFFLY